MRSYRKITLFENKRRVQKLQDFRNDVVGYFNSLQRNDQWLVGREMVETPESSQLRQKINLQLDVANDLLLATGQRAVYLHREAPAFGGRQTPVDLLQNIFLLPQLEIPPQNLTDAVERSIGIYQNDFPAARRRTFNLFFWLGLGLDYIAGLPFRLLGKLGFNQRKAENSVVGRSIKGTLYLITVIAALLTILDLLGYIDGVKEWVQEIVGAAESAAAD